MKLPFTHDQFLDVFAAYNGALWPVAALLWCLVGISAALALGILPDVMLLAGAIALAWYALAPGTLAGRAAQV